MGFSKICTLYFTQGSLVPKPLPKKLMLFETLFIFKYTAPVSGMRHSVIEFRGCTTEVRTQSNSAALNHLIRTGVKQNYLNRNFALLSLWTANF